jgi:hypothetical protein
MRINRLTRCGPDPSILSHSHDAGSHLSLAPSCGNEPKARCRALRSHMLPCSHADERSSHLPTPRDQNDDQRTLKLQSELKVQCLPWFDAFDGPRAGQSRAKWPSSPHYKTKMQIQVMHSWSRWNSP